MLGAIAGDICGSIYEAAPIKHRDFPLFQPHCRFTDDSVLTIAVAEAILSGRPYREALWTIGNRYPDAGYGGSFRQWLAQADPQPYQSWGNGAAMRVSPIGFAYASEAEVLAQAQQSAAVSHDHPEGIKGAQASALTVFLARTGHGKDAIRTQVSTRFGYDLQRSVASIRPTYRFDVACQGSVPEAIIAFLDADAYEDALRNAISLGGDSDTLACMAGGFAEAFYGGVPNFIQQAAQARLPNDLWRIVEAFYQRYSSDYNENERS